MKYSNASLPPMSFLVSRTVTLRVPFNEAAERVCEGVGETYGPAEREKKKTLLGSVSRKKGPSFQGDIFSAKRGSFQRLSLSLRLQRQSNISFVDKVSLMPREEKKTFFPSHVPCRWKLPLARRDLCLKERG